MGSFIQEVLALIKRKEAIESLLPNRDFIRIGRERDSLLKTPAYVPEMEDHVIRADAFACSLLETILSADPNYIPVISTPPPDANCDAGFLVNSIIFQDPSTGKLRFDGYGSGTHTGTSTFMLAVDALGNVIEVISTDADTKYDLTASNPATDEIDLDLTGTDGTTDTVKFIGGTNINLSLSGNEVTIDGTDLNTTYTYDLNVVGQNHILELNGSDGSTDSITLVPGTNVTFFTVGDTINISSEDTTYTLSFADPNITLTGSDGSTSIIDISSIDHNTTNVSLNLAGTVLILTDSDGNTVSQDLASIDTDTTNVSLTLTGTTLDLLDSAGNTVSANLSSLDNDTTYTLDAAQNTTNVDITLDASAGTDSTITLVAGTNIALTESTGNITIDATDTNTLYDISSSQATPTSNVVVTLNASGTDPDSTITLAAGPNVTLTDNGSNQITIDANADTDTTYTLGFSNPNITLTDSNGVIQSVNISSINTDTTNVQFYLIGTTLYLEDSAGNTINQNLASIDTNTTYALSSAQNGSDADIILTGTNPTSTDTVKLVAGNNITISNTGNNITINAAADTDTTYDLSGVGSTNGTAGVRLTGSDTTTDDVLIVGSGTTTVTRSLNTLTVTSNDQFVGTVTSVSAGTGIEITGTGTINPTVNIDYAGTNNAILVATSATPVGADTLWFSDATDNTIKKALISDMPGFGADGTVTSVALTETGTALTITGSPITTSGTINIAGAGSSSQVILGDLTLGAYTDGTVTSIGIAADNGAGTGITTSGTFTFTGGTNVTTSVTGNTVTINSTDQFTGTVTSVGLSMPTAFTVTNSPVTTSGTLTVAGAGTTSQYIDGTGALQTFPTIPTVPTNIVETVTTTDGTFIDLTPNTATDGNVTVTAELSATGTPSATTYLRGDNTWATLPADLTGVNTLNSLDGDLTLAAGSNVTITDNGSNTITIASTDQFTGTVTSVGTSSSTFVDVTGGTITTTGTITAALSATGTPSATTYLRGDNTWASLPTDNNTTYTYSAAQSGSNVNLNLVGSDATTDTVTLAAGTNVTLSEASDVVTITTDNTTNTSLTLSGSNILTLTDSDANTVTADLSSLADSLWTEDTINGYLYPDTLSHDVGIGTATPSANLHVLGSDSNVSTPAFIVENSSGDNTLEIRNNGTLLQNIVNAPSSIAIGFGALTNITTTFGRLVAVGFNALDANTSGYDNTAVGHSTLSDNTTGSFNTAVGKSALGNNTTGSHNTAVGVSSLDSNSTGNYNTALGKSALRFTTSNYNTGVGYQAAEKSSTGTQNVALGAFSLWSNTTGSRNISIGSFSIEESISGSDNIAIGDRAGEKAVGNVSNTTPSTSIYIGNSVTPNANNEQNQIIIGHQGVGFGSNTATFGNSSITTTHLYGQLNLEDYGSGTYTGTAAYALAVNSSGEVIEIATAGSSPVDGSGTANYLPKWLDSNTLTDSLAYDDGGGQFVFEGSFFTGQSVATDSTNKSIRLATKHYTNAEEPFVGLLATSTSTANIVEIGGGTSLGNAATTVSFRTASNNTTVTGTERMRINSSGNVGIGTTTPSEKLSIEGNLNLLASGTERFSIKKLTSPSIEYKLASNNYHIHLESVGTSQGDIIMSTGSTSAAEQMRITSTGAVGIGTSSPSARLHIVGSGTTSATNSLLVENSAGTDLLQITDSGNAIMNINYLQLDEFVGGRYLKISPAISGANHKIESNSGSAIEISSSTGLNYTLGGSGQLTLNQYTSTTFDGTPTSFLGVDASGNVIKTTSAGVLTPNLQEVTDVGNTTTNDIIAVSGASSTASIFTSESGSISANAIGIETDGATNKTRLFNTGTGTQLKIESLGTSASIAIAARSFVDIGTDHNGSAYGTYTSRVRIENSTGDVGIGTTSPAARTHIVGADDLFATKGLLVENSSGTDTFYVTNEGIAGMTKQGVTAAYHFTGKESNAGAYSTLFGHQAGSGSNITTGNYQVMVGAFAGDLATGADKGTYVGGAAGYNSNGNQQVYIGYQAGHTTNGSDNILVGYYTRWVTGSSNVAIGRQAGDQAYGGQNIYIGSLAGYALGASGVNSDNNVMIGYESGRGSADGTDNNVFVGYRTAYNTTNLGGGNTVIGYGMLNGSTEALSNTVVIGAGGNERLRFDSAGQMQLINYGSGTHTGTAAYGLAVDSSGEVIETTAPLTAVPNLQQVTNVGNTTTNSIRLTSGQYELYTGTTEIGVIKNTSGVFDIRTASTRDIKLGSTTYGDIMFLEGVDGSVGIGTNSPEERLHVEGNVRADSFGVEGSTTSHPTRVLAPAGAEYRNTGVVTGAIVVVLPQSWTNTMLNFTVNLYDYSTNETIKIKVAGYNYAPSTQWYQTTAIVESSPVEDKNIRVRFGHDGTKCVVVIGDTTSTWEYPNASVSEFFAGHSNTELEKWNDGWNITVITTTDGYSFSGTDHTNTQVNNWARSGQDLYYGSGTGNVGIGTTSPSAKTDIVGDYIGRTLRLEATSTSKSNGVYTLEVDSSAHTSNITAAGALKVDVNSGTALLVNGQGNVGIGTTSPSYTLEVDGGTDNTIASFVSTDAGSYISFVDSSTTSGEYVQIGASGNGMIIRTNNSQAITVADTGAMRLHSYGSGTFTGTAAYTLAVDSSGNIIETSGGGSTPTLQEVTTAGNTTTDDVGIQMSNPVSALHVGDGNNTVSSALYSTDIVNISAQNTAPGLNIISAGTSSFNRGVFKATRSRGTLASPSAAVSGDYVFSLLGAVYDGTSSYATAGVEMLVDGAVTTGNAPQRIEFQTGTTTSRSTRMTIKSDGDIGVNTTNPLAKLHLVGADTSVATDALLIENSGGSDLFKITNSGNFYMSSASRFASIVINNVDTVGTGNYSTIVGYQAGDGTNTNGLYLTAIGARAAQLTNGGTFSVAIGMNSARNAGSLSNAVVVGMNAVNNSGGFSNSVAVGRSAAEQSNLTTSTIVGYYAGRAMGTTQRSNNVYIGYNVASSSNNQSGNTFIGSNIQSSSTEALNNTVIIGSSSQERLRVSADGDVTWTGGNYMKIQTGTTASRPASPVPGMIRFNTTTEKFEGYVNSITGWVDFH